MGGLEKASRSVISGVTLMLLAMQSAFVAVGASMNSMSPSLVLRSSLPGVSGSRFVKNFTVVGSGAWRFWKTASMFSSVKSFGMLLK